MTKSLGKGTRDLGIIAALEKTATGVLEEEKRAAGVPLQRQIPAQGNEIRDENSEDLGRQQSGESQPIQSKPNSQICSAVADGQSDQSKQRDGKPPPQSDRQCKAQYESNKPQNAEKRPKPVLRKREAPKQSMKVNKNMLPPDVGCDDEISEVESAADKLECQSQKLAKGPTDTQNEMSVSSVLSK